MSISNPTPAEVKGVSVEHPRIKEYAKNMIRNGDTNDRIVKIIGMPHQVIDKYRQEVEREKK